MCVCVREREREREKIQIFSVALYKVRGVHQFEFRLFINEA